MRMFRTLGCWLATMAGVIAIGWTLANGLAAQDDSLDMVPSSAMGAVFLKPKDALGAAGDGTVAV